MKINFAKKEYKALLDMIQIADWVIHSHETEENPDFQVYSALEQKTCSFAEALGLGDLIQHDNPALRI